MSKLMRILDSEVLQRSAATVVAIGLLLLLPSRVAEAVEKPTVWHWAFVVGSAGAIVVFTNEAMTMWRKHFGLVRKDGPDHTFVVPEDVPVLDVESAIESTSDRISAIKALREQHRGLGLKAAADLIDTALDERGE